LQAWLADRPEQHGDIEAIKTIELPRYLAQTEEIELPVAERLRLLALHVEREACAAPQPRGWSGLRRIYDLALKSATSDDERDAVLYSLAASAQRCAGSLHGDGHGHGDDHADDHADDDQADDDHADDRGGQDPRRRILDEGYAAAGELAQSTGAVGEARELLGVLTYFDPEGDIEAAIEHFGAAIEQGHTSGWAPFYRACALHDLERWGEALAAYDLIEAEWFVGPQLSWRYEAYLDQRAWCALQAGERERAIEEFRALITRYVDNPELRQDAWAECLREASAGPLKAELAVLAVPLWRLLDEI
jgi:tetratricopeptide (TPR) repeat protein